MKTYIIDDEEISVYLTKYMLLEEKFSDEIISYHSAEEALPVLLQNIAANEPQIIFLDLNMPGMDGWELLEKLTPHKEKFNNCCQNYILTSSLDLNDTVKAEEYDIVCGFIHKPIDQTDVQEIMARLKMSSP